MSDWTPPPTTRWWLEGVVDPELEVGLCLVTETGVDGDAPCPIEPPERPLSRGFTETGEHAGWLSSVGIGVTTTFGDGAHGWIEHTILRRREPPRRKPKRASRARRAANGDDVGREESPVSASAGRDTRPEGGTNPLPTAASDQPTQEAMF